MLQNTLCESAVSCKLRTVEPDIHRHFSLLPGKIQIRMMQIASCEQALGLIQVDLKRLVCYKIQRVNQWFPVGFRLLSLISTHAFRNKFTLSRNITFRSRCRLSCTMMANAVDTAISVFLVSLLVLCCDMLHHSTCICLVYHKIFLGNRRTPANIMICTVKKTCNKNVTLESSSLGVFIASGPGNK